MDTILFKLEASYVGRMGYPLMRTLNIIITRTKEAGLAYKWLADLENIVFITDSSSDAVVLSFHHLQASFIILIVGLMLSFAMFICEFISHKYASF